MFKRLLPALSTLVVTGLLAAPAHADDLTTTVLGLLSDEAEVNFAEEFSGYLRSAADAREELGHTGKDQTLEQVAMAFGCLESLDPMCLQEIGEGLETGNLIYGRVEPVGDGSSAALKVTVTLFDVVEGKVIKATAVEIPNDKQSSIYLQEASERIFEELFGEEQKTTLIVQSNVGNATISLDGEEVGTTGSEPLWLRDIEPGEHELSVEKEGYVTFTEKFDLEKGGRVDIDAPMYKEGEKPPPDTDTSVSPVGPGPEKKKDKTKIKLISGVVVGTLGLAMLGAGAGMTAMVASANDDLESARNVTLSQMDVCSCFNASTPSTDCFGSPAWPGGVDQSAIKDACSKGKTGQAAQFVFYGLGAVAVGVGLYLIIDSVIKKKKSKSSDKADKLEDDDDLDEEDDDDLDEDDDDEFEDEEFEDEEEEAKIKVQPWFSPDGGFITLTGHF